MGTAGQYPGPGGGTPLVPTWLGPDDGEAGPQNPPDAPPPAPPDRPPPQPPIPDRFRVPRGNFTRFVRSGGGDRASLGRAVRDYVSTSSGGARVASQRMGSSRATTERLLRFLGDVRERGARQALRSLQLEALAGRPVEDIFRGLVDYICPDGGTVDEGIARGAFIEAIAELSGQGITDLDGLTVDEIQTVLELVCSHAIEARLCNDIGMSLVSIPADVETAARVQTQLRDFIRRGVADALTIVRGALAALTPERVSAFVTDVYESAFGILQVLGDREAT